MTGLVRWAVLALAVAALAVAPATAGVAAAAPSGAQVDRVVLLGIPGLRWQDVDEQRTPALAQLHRQGASGVLSIRTAADRDCLAAGWLTLGAGNRVDPVAPEPAGCSAILPSPSTLPEQVRANARRREGAVPGALAAALGDQGSCVAARGPGAELAAADPRGRFGALPGATTTCPVLLQAVGLRDGDVLLGSELRGRAPSTVVLVVGLPDAADGVPHLHVAMAIGPGFGPGGLVSPSTRRTPYVQLVDVAPTVLALLGKARPASMIGEPWNTSGQPPSLTALRDADLKAQGQRDVTVPFFVVLCGLQLALLAPLLRRRRWRAAEVVALAGTTAVGASYLANLVPWWRADQPLLQMLGVTAAVTVALTAVTLMGRGLLARAGIACALVAAVLVGDLLTGATLQLSSVAGYSPLVAGRFAGIGNVAFGVLAASALLAAASTRRPALAALTALVVVVDGAPQWGSDVGGVLALVPAYAVLVLLLSGRTASLAKVALAALAGVAVVTAFGVADHARPAAERTHLGRFVGQVLDGTAGDVLHRKAAANLSLLFHSPVTALLPVVVLALVVVVLRPPSRLRTVFDRSPAWRAGMLSLATAAGLGFVLNDSGSAVVALAIVVALPATIAVVARHARLSASAG
ncbi:MAG: hypothetical protein ABIO67_02215 [Mycobacteriales bacterium]